MAFVGCGDDASSSGSGAECNGAKCDNAEDDDADGPARRCGELVSDFSGHSRSVEDILSNSDPIAKLILASDAERCPMSVADIVEGLKAGGCSGHGSQFVSERSQLLGAYTDYRSVTQLTCDGKQVFLHYPILGSDVKDIEMTENGPRLGPNVNADRLVSKLDHTFPAIISEDERGVFNYYQSRSEVHRVCTPRGGFLTEDGAFPDDAKECKTTDQCEEGQECIQRPDDLGIVADFRFFGDSMDFVALPNRDKTIEAMAQALPGPVTTEADIDHSLDVERNCAVCHPAGGLTMRELESPWVHWEAGGHFASPQTSDLIDNAKDILGSKKNGLNFEGTVKNANRKFLTSRIDLSLEAIATEASGARTIGTAELLRPLFCTDEFNLLTTGSRPGVDFTSMRFRDIILDKEISPSDSISTSHDKFLARLETQDWRLWGFGVGPFAGALPDVPRETLGTLTFLHRAQIDSEYQSQLVDRGIIDDEFVNDVLKVDFTRAIFSEERCDLIDIVGRVDPLTFLKGGNVSEETPQLLRDAVIAELEKEGGSGAEADFLANLQEEGTSARDAAKAFVDQCKGRPEDEMLNDYIDYVAQVRKRAAHQETAMSHGESSFLMYRFPGTNGFMAPDAMAQAFVHGLRFDPETCTLIDHYPGQQPAVEEPEDPPAPQPDGDNDPGDLSCSVRGCDFTPGAACQCDDGCVAAGDCCEFGGEHDGPAKSCG
ncbi:MAG: hypothetical protein AAF721_14515 [Myxococcota bacterium]